MENVVQGCFDKHKILSFVVTLVAVGVAFEALFNREESGMILPERTAHIKYFRKTNKTDVVPTIILKEMEFVENNVFGFLLTIKNNQNSLFNISGLIISNENGMIRGENSSFLYPGLLLAAGERIEQTFRFVIEDNSIFSNFSIAIIDSSKEVSKEFHFFVPLSIFDFRISEIIKNFPRPLKVFLFGFQGVAKSSIVNTILSYLVHSVSPLNIVQVADVKTGDGTTTRIESFGRITFKKSYLDGIVSSLIDMIQVYDTPGLRKDEYCFKTNCYDSIFSGNYDQDWDMKGPPVPGPDGVFDGEIPDIVILCTPFNELDSVPSLYGEVGKSLSMSASKHKIPVILGLSMIDKTYNMTSEELKKELEPAQSIFHRVLLIDSYRVGQEKDPRVELNIQDFLLFIAKAVDITRF